MLRTAILSMAALATLALGINAPLPDHGVQGFVWEVDAFGNGTTVNLAGTIEQVYEQLAKINPDFSPHDTELHSSEADPSVNQANASVLCGSTSWNWEYADTESIKEGIRYLRGVTGKPTGGPGPGNCARVSCSENSAIWWCNDNKNPFTLPSFETIADCAQVVVDDCNKETESPTDMVAGQNFNDNHWNCIVRGDDC